MTTQIKVTEGDARQRQVEFQTKVQAVAGANRFEFLNNKGYAYSPGKSRPQIFAMV